MIQIDKWQVSRLKATKLALASFWTVRWEDWLVSMYLRRRDPSSSSCFVQQKRSLPEFSFRQVQQTCSSSNVSNEHYLTLAEALPYIRWRKILHDITKRQLDCQPVIMLEWSFISQIQFSLWESFQLIMVGIHPALWFAKNVTLRRPGELGVVLNYQKAAGSVAGMQLAFDVFAHVGWKLGAHLGAWANSVFEQKLWNKLGSKNATTATIKQTPDICMFSMSLEVLWRTIVQVFSWRLWGAWFHVTLDCRCLKIGVQVTGSGCSNKL